MKALLGLGALLLSTSSAFAGLLTVKLVSTTPNVSAFNFGAYSWASDVTSSAGLAWLAENKTYYTSYLGDRASVSVTQNFDVYWQETIPNEGLPANLYLKLGLVGEEGVILTTSVQLGDTGAFGLQGSAAVSTGMGRGPLLPASSVTWDFGTDLGPPLFYVFLKQSGAAGHLTTTLSPAWTLVHTDVSGLRTWEAPESVTSATASFSNSPIAWYGILTVAYDIQAAFSEAVYFDIHED